MNWCRTHPTYRSKREPTGLCKRCWQLYKYSHPEAIEVLTRTYQEAAELGKPLEGES